MDNISPQSSISVVRYNKRFIYILGILLFLVFIAAFVALEAQKNNGILKYAEAKEMSAPQSAWYKDKPDYIERPVVKPTEFKLPELPPPVLAPQKEPEDLNLKRRREEEFQAMRATTKVSLTIPPSSKSVQKEDEKGVAGEKYSSELDALSKLSESQKAPEQSFLERAQKEVYPAYLNEKLKLPISPYELKAGTLIPAALISGINSDLPGQIVAQVTQNVFDTVSGKYLLLPQGAKLIGIYDSGVIYGQERVQIAWKRLILPDGKSLMLRGMSGVDEQGYSGFHDQVNNHYMRIFGSAILMSFISAGVQMSQPQESASYGGVASPRQELAASLGQNLGDVSSKMVEKNMNIAPTLEIRPGYLFNVMVREDIVFPGPKR
ncbi:MAG: conjugal transfer protein TrbI [Deltaproteobacteria bacterium]|nr:conjugal transfer protein TrbI [Deltaproteobacteria bacterium]